MLRVPLVDVSARARGADARRRLAVEIDEACREVGFLVVTGHGIDDGLRADAFAAARRFFALPVEAKLRCRHPDPNVPRGYKALGAEAQAYANEPGAAGPPDLSETFALGTEPVPDDAYHRDGARYFAANLWPAEAPDIAAPLLAYRAACQALAVDLLRLGALALGVDEEFFTPYVERPIGTLRLNGYPAVDGPLPPNQFRGGPHTDYGSLTILAVDGVPGLEVQDADGGWWPVPHVPGTFVVNVADLLSRWTNGRWRSTWHRVVAPQGPGPHPARLSLAYFQFPDYDASIVPVPTCVAPGQVAPEPIAAGDFLAAKLARLFAV